jgi:shikimate kinase
VEKFGKKNIYLVGLMGAGKTVLGRSLAQRLRLDFKDSDHEIEARTGVCVSTIFEIEGEAGFRKRESRVLAELSALKETVISTGGGAVLLAENRARMNSSGFVIYLNAPPQALYERLRHDKSRPLLKGPDPLKKLEELFEARDALYRDVADLVVESGGLRAAFVLRMIEEGIEDRWIP